MHLALAPPGPLFSYHRAEKGILDLIRIFSSLKEKKRGGLVSLFSTLPYNPLVVFLGFLGKITLLFVHDHI
jgi:hypothetical protein